MLPAKLRNYKNRKYGVEAPPNHAPTMYPPCTPEIYTYKSIQRNHLVYSPIPSSKLSAPSSAKDSFFRLMGHYARSPGLKNCILMRRRALVVLLTPSKVPSGGDDEEGKEDDRGVVHELGGDGNGRRHAEEGDSESRPACIVLANIDLMKRNRIVNVHSETTLHTVPSGPR